MINGASRILNIMKSVPKNTVSVKTFVTVHSVSPLTFKLDDKLILTSEFYVLSDDIIKSRLAVGQKLLAFSFNDAQCYFIHQAIDKSKIKMKLIDNLNDPSIIDALTANQGKVIGERLYDIETELPTIKSRLSSLESQVANIKSQITDLDSRITVLEQKIV